MWGVMHTSGTHPSLPALSMGSVYAGGAATRTKGVGVLACMHGAPCRVAHAGCQHLDLAWPTGGVNGVGEQGLCCGWDNPRVPSREINGTVNKVAADAFSAHRLLMHLR